MARFSSRLIETGLTRWLVLAALLVVMAVEVAASQDPSAPAVPGEPVEGRRPDRDAATRATALIDAARRAAGITTTPSRPRTFSASGRSRRFIRYVAVKSPTRIEERQRELSGRFEYQFVLPDRFRIWMKGETLGGFGFKVEEIVNGQNAWRNPPLTVRSFNRDSRVIDVGDVERTLMMQAQTARQQVAFQSLGNLVVTPTAYPLEWRETGLFEHEGQSFDAAIAETRDGLRLSLLFDPQTRLLTGLATAYVDSFQEAVVAEVASVDRRFIASTYARAREERRRRRHPRQRQQVIWRFTDHRPVAGILIPHRSTVYFNGQLIEENTLTNVRIDDAIDPRRFAGEEKVKY